MPDFGAFAAWSSRKRILLPTPTADLTDFPNCIKIVADAGMAEALANGHDIRFTASDGVTELPYERESWSGGGGSAVTAIIWVKSDVSTAGTHIYVYYGNAAAADGEDAEAVWDDDFKAVYHMKDATTSMILDSTGNDSDGAKKGANEPIEADGKVGKGQEFAGDNDYINIDHAGLLDTIDENYCISAWFKKDDTDAGDQILLGKDENTTYQQYMIGWRGTAFKFEYAHVNHSVDELLYPAWNSDVIDANWHHVVAAWDGARVRLYADGSEVTSKILLTHYAYTSANRHSIGRYGGYGDYFFDGIADETRISSIARSADWIAYEYANMNPADGGLTWGSEEHTAVPAGGMKPMDLRLKI